MAKKKSLKTVKEKVIEKEVIPNPIIITSNTKVELNSESEPNEMVITQPSEIPDPNIRTVIGLTSAEHLQKSGWQLIDCQHTLEGKKYNFRKVN